MRRPHDEVQAMIARLEAVVGKVPPVSGFNDDNKGAIEACLQVLRERLSEEKVFERFDDDRNEASNIILDEARNAAQWLDGNEDLEWIEGWEEMAAR